MTMTTTMMMMTTMMMTIKTRTSTEINSSGRAYTLPALLP